MDELKYDADSGQTVEAGRLAAGTIMDKRFEILEYRGQGATGEVYRARNVLTDELVAVKILSFGFASESSELERFFREAKVAGQLKHEGIVSIKAFAKTPEGTVYMVMEYLEGRTLAELISLQGKLKLEDLLNPISVVAEGLAHAHDQGVVHRDIKPSNIMLLNFAAAESSAKILDFGLAQLFETTAANQSLTKTGTIMGTPAYMSPERCRSEKASPASDIYSFGCLLYEALTGKQPFSAGSPLELMSKQISEPLSFPRGAVPDKVKSIISRCMEKNAAARYGSARDIPAELRRAAAEPMPQRSLPRLAIAMFCLILLLGAVFWPRNQRIASLQQAGGTAASSAGKAVTVGILLRKAESFKRPEDWSKMTGFYEEATILGDRKLPPPGAELTEMQKSMLQDLLIAHRCLASRDESGQASRLRHLQAAVALADNYSKYLTGIERRDTYNLAASCQSDAAIRTILDRKSVDSLPGDPGQAIQVGFRCLERGSASQAEVYEKMARGMPGNELGLSAENEIGLSALRAGILQFKGKTAEFQKAKKHLLSLSQGQAARDEILTLVMDPLAEAASKVPDLSQALEWNNYAFEFSRNCNEPSAQKVRQAAILIRRAELLRQKKAWREILEVDKKGMALQLPLSSLQFDSNDGRAFLELNEYKNAIASLNKALSTAKKMDFAFYQLQILPYLMSAQKDSGDLASARQSARQIKELVGNKQDENVSIMKKAESILQENQ